MASRLDQIVVVNTESDRVIPYEDPFITEVHICLIDIRKRDGILGETISVQSEYEHDSYEYPSTSWMNACQILQKKYLSSHRTWASYGDYTRLQVIRQCMDSKVDYPFSSTHINVKNLVALIYGLDHEVGLSHMSAMLNIPQDSGLPRGMEVAWNTTVILAKILSSIQIA